MISVLLKDKTILEFPAADSSSVGTQHLDIRRSGVTFARIRAEDWTAVVMGVSGEGEDADFRILARVEEGEALT